jgi:hypothetical protein
MDLGYLTVYASHALKKGTLRPHSKAWVAQFENVDTSKSSDFMKMVLGWARRPGDDTLDAGRLGIVSIQPDNNNVLLGTPFTFTKSNIDLFDF